MATTRRRADAGVPAGRPLSFKDSVAIASAATTGFTPHNTARSQTWYAARACLAALDAAGLSTEDVDGLCGSWPSAAALQSALGVPELTWSANPVIPFGNHIAAAASAIHSGLCEVALVYHAPYRAVWNTASSMRDPFRRAATPGLNDPPPPPESVASSVGYAAWASRYAHKYSVPREHFGYLALNARHNALRNPAAAMREPLTMQDYLAARMVRDPLCLLDMDVPVDGGDAFVLTSAARARDLALPPVLIQSVVLGQTAPNEEDQIPGLHHHGQHVVVRTLRERSDFWIDNMDLFFPYDGFTVIGLNWIENVGLCEPGQAGPLIEQHRNAQTGEILLNGRVPVNPHGGSLGEGGTQGSGQVREAVHQLQGVAGERQVSGAATALLCLGGFFFNAQGVTLRRDG
jgi:acetyl-CoA acetyltransferase